jgi:cardiolipin synthase
MSAPRSRVLTIPNLISLVRLLCVPVFLWMLWKADPARRGAAILLAVLGASDWVDGWIARRYDQGSELGKIVLAREVVIATATVGLALAGARRIDVVWAGKAGTLALMFALPMFLIADAASSVRSFFDFTGWGFAIGGIVLGYFAAAKYVPAARVALREGRTARPVGSEVTS